MKSTIVAVVDASLARVFALDKNDRAGTSKLVELTELEQPERRALASEKFSDSRPGLRRSPGTGHGVDDRRDSNIERHDREFAQKIARELAVRVQDPEIAVLVLAASPNMLGMLRPHLDGTVRADVAVRDIGANVTARSVSEIHDFLTAKDLLPPRGRAR